MSDVQQAFHDWLGPMFNVYSEKKPDYEVAFKAGYAAGVAMQKEKDAGICDWEAQCMNSEYEKVALHCAAAIREQSDE